MRRLSVLWLWILAGLSGVFVLCALALYGIHHYAKSHSYEATIEATFTSATASPPPPIASTQTRTYIYRAKLRFPSHIFRYQRDFTLLTDLSTQLILNAPDTQLISTITLDKNYLVLETKSPISAISSTLHYTIAIAPTLWKKLLLGYGFVAGLCLLLSLVSYKYHALQILAKRWYSKIPAQSFAAVTNSLHQSSSVFCGISYKRWILIACGVVFLIGFGLRWWYMGQKIHLHGDEVWSVAISSHSKGCLWGGECRDGVYYGKEIKELELWHNASPISALKDIGDLYLTNNGDSHSHANLYYTILRLWHIGVRTGDLGWIIQRGVGVNLLLFYPLAFLFGFLLGRQLFGSSVLVLAFVSLAFLNGASISNTMLIREYALQECLFLAFAWIMARQFCRASVSRAEIILGAFVLACFLLSGYFVLLYVLMLGGILVFLSLGASAQKAKALLATFGLGVGFTYAMYPIYHKGFFGGHASSALDRAGGVGTNLAESMNAYGEILGQNIFTPIILGLCCVSLFVWYKNARLMQNLWSKEVFLAVLMGVLALVFGVVIMAVAPWKILRFVVASLPLLCLLLVVVLMPMLLRRSLVACVAWAGIILSLMLYHKVGFLSYPEEKDRASFAVYQMEPILDTELQGDRAIPTIYSHISDYSSTRVIAWFNDLRLYYFIKDPWEALATLTSHKRCFFITGLPIEVVRDYLGSGFRVELMQHTFGLNRYYIEHTEIH